MLTTIKDFLVGIGDAIVSLWDFIIGFFEDLVYIIQLTGKFVLNIPSYFAWMPGEIVTLIIMIFSIVVIYKVLGREG